MSHKVFVTLCILLFIAFVTVCISLFVGGYSVVHIFNLTEQEYFILMEIRIPRIICAMMAGACLAVSGTAIQALLKNPLAEPSIVGVSSGCALFAAIGIIFSGNIILITSFAFFGGVTATFLVLLIGIITRVEYGIILAGIAINTICGAGIGLLLFMSNNNQLRDVTFWMMGSLGSSSWKQVGILIPSFVFSYIIFLKNAKALNILALGCNEARNIGVNTLKLKISIILATCISVSITVSFFGIIAFIGLIVPHLIRMILGSNNIILMVISPILGGILLLISDGISRTIALPAEIPIGIITSLIGGPFFIYLMLKKNVGV